MNPLICTNKAMTLELVSKHIRSATVLPQVSFSVAQWQENSRTVIDRIVSSIWGKGPMIVRSSSIAEDRAAVSMAGHYLSIPNVVGDSSLETAIANVIDSYGDDACADDCVLVQPMLADVAVSGVAFSRDPNTGSDYFVINYNVGSDTTAVTGGRSDGLKTAYFWKGATLKAPAPLDAIVRLMLELDDLFGEVALDVEFACDGGGQVYLFQVRPLAVRNEPLLSKVKHTEALANIGAKVDAANRPHPYLHGRRAVYGIMPDWNPAEIVGVRPRPLALSLYREIITDSIWAYQRHNYGYKNLRSFPLLVEFYGLPYIDVRVSFNSFIPADVPAELADRLVDYYIDRLLSMPALHDKVEFEIVLTCYSFDLPERLERLQTYGFTKQDCEHLKGALNRLTNRIIRRETGLWHHDMERIETLKRRQATIMTAELDTVSRIYWLLEDCKRYGSLPFAGLARAGFIAVQILRSLVGKGVLSESECSSFMAGLNTISASMGRDLATLDRQAFLQKYGHLRPGTFDILSPRYDEAPDLYFDWSVAHPLAADERSNFTLSLAQMRTIGQLLEEHQLEHDVVGMFDFLDAGINGREYSKFVFTKSLSDALSLIAKFGEQHGFSRDDMSYLNIHAIYNLFTSSGNVRDVLAESIARGREGYESTRAIVLPPTFTSGNDVWSFEMPEADPNFITQIRVTAPVAVVAPGADLHGKIAMIINADPGFDWIFSRGIKGLITAYGGLNSHMAIRAAELSLPAVIGAGEVLFEKWSTAQVVEIDAVNRQVRILR